MRIQFKNYNNTILQNGTSALYIEGKKSFDVFANRFENTILKY